MTAQTGRTGAQMYDRIVRAADAVRERCGGAEIGLILGSGLADSIQPENAVTMPYADIPDFPISTAAGHKSEWVCGTVSGKRVCMMRGRFHYYEGYTPEDVVLPVRVMKLLGVKTLIVTNAAGGVNTDFNPGDLMLITDVINYSGVNPLIGPNIDELGPRFPDMSRACDPAYRALAASCAADMGLTLREGVYMWFSGPSYETPAEIRMARTLGADAVGMSTVPEIIAARHCGLRVLGLTCITNMAAGILNQPLSHAEVTETAARVQAAFTDLVGRVIGGM